MKQETTLDELAGMVAGGFAEVKVDVAAVRADVAARRADTVKELGHVQATPTRIENRQNALEDRTLSDLQVRIARLEAGRLRA